MRTRWCLAPLGAAVLLNAGAQGLGCSSSTSTAPHDAGADRSAVDGAPASDCTGAPPVMQVQSNGGLGLPDWSCYAGDAGPADEGGAGDAAVNEGGAGDAGATARFHLTDFSSGDVVPDAPVDIFYGGSVRAAPDATFTTGSKSAGVPSPTNAGTGEFFFAPPPSTVFAYRVNARAAAAGVAPIKALIEFDATSPKADGTVDGNAITESGFNLLVAGILGSSQPAPGTGVLAVPTRDCAGHDVRGVIVTLVDDATGNPVTPGSGPTDMHAGYFQNGQPSATCAFTSADQALWAAINAPTNGTDATHGYTLRLTGRMTDADATPAVFAEKKIEIWADTINLERPFRLTAK